MPSAPIAVYYPHTRIQSEGLVKTALLLWDQVECLVPRGSYIGDTGLNRTLQEAHDLIVRDHVPSEVEKQRVHRRMSSLLRDGIPQWMHCEPGEGENLRHFVIYAEKVGSNTWDLLRQLDLAHEGSVDLGMPSYAVPQALGLFLISLMAEECAGQTRLRITDRTQAYTWLLALITEELGGRYFPAMDVSNVFTAYDRLIPIALRTVNVDDIPIERLIALRRREVAESSRDLQTLRRLYRDKTEKFVLRLSESGITERDQEEIGRQYQNEMENDLRDLKRELGVSARKALLSKEVCVAIVAAAGALLTPFFGSAIAAATINAVGVGALINTHLDYRTARTAALARHAMSWLYLGAGSRHQAL